MAPLTTQLSPSRTAVVATMLVSDPKPGSVNANPVTQPFCSTGSFHRFTCSGVPSALTTSWPMPLFIAYSAHMSPYPIAS